MTNPQDLPLPEFTEHRIPREGGSVYVRDFAGNGPAFVVLHGFPDNSYIYDDLFSHLVSAGRRAIAIDFLGLGASDKPGGALCSFAQQLGDLEAVVEGLVLDKIIPVGHDAGGPAAVNFALRRPQRTAAVTLRNAFYGEARGLKVPELIAVFSNKELKALHLHFLQSPQQLGWLLDFQRIQLQAGLTQARRFAPRLSQAELGHEQQDMSGWESWPTRPSGPLLALRACVSGSSLALRVGVSGSSLALRVGVRWAKPSSQVDPEGFVVQTQPGAVRACRWRGVGGGERCPRTLGKSGRTSGEWREKPPPTSPLVATAFRTPSHPPPAAADNRCT